MTMLATQQDGKTIDDEPPLVDFASSPSSQLSATARPMPLVADPLLSDDDSDFLVRFQNAAMTRYMKGTSDRWNQKTFYANLDALTTCLKILQTPMDGDCANTSEEILRSYASYAWVLHFKDLLICETHVNCATDADVATVVESLLDLHVNGMVAADHLLKQEGNCYRMILQTSGIVRIGYWFSRYDATHPDKTALTKTLAENPEQFFNPFVKWHAAQWVKQVTEDHAQKAYWNVYFAYSTVCRAATFG
jgi:hypothetical protein